LGLFARNHSLSWGPAASNVGTYSAAGLPFQNLSGGPEQEYFADGVVEDITTALSRMRWLFVIARNSSFTFKGRSVDVKQVGRKLGVRYVLEGSVRKAQNRVRITGQLIDAMLRIAHRADARQRKLQLAVAGDFDNLPGKGVRAKIAGSDV
jgi:TolB-like protein